MTNAHVAAGGDATLPLAWRLTVRDQDWTTATGSAVRFPRPVSAGTAKLIGGGRCGCG